MMYVGYPRLTPWERYEHLPNLDNNINYVDPSKVIGKSDNESTVKDLRLVIVGNTPTYLLLRNNIWHAYDATTGILIKTGLSVVLAAANSYSPGAKVTYLGVKWQDMWTHTDDLDQHRPLHRVSLDDADGTDLYISSQTGEIVRDATRMERYFNFIGTWLHWAYMFRGEGYDHLHVPILISMSVVAVFMLLMGIWIGVLRLRIKDRQGTSIWVPTYRGQNWKWWHHILGLVFATTTLLWMFSGLMSANPAQIFTLRNQPAMPDLFAGGQLDTSAFEIPPHEAIASVRSKLGQIKEVKWHWFDSEPWYIVYDETGRSQVVSGKSPLQFFTTFDVDRLVVAAARSYPDARIIRKTVLNTYDNYYLQREPHTMDGYNVRRLPVLRVEFDDIDNTWLHLDPYTGTIHNRLDDRRRLRRWIFAAFHSWDIIGLIDRRPLWDIILISLSVGGFTLSVTSIILSLRRLQRLHIIPRSSKHGSRMSDVR